MGVLGGSGYGGGGWEGGIFFCGVCFEVDEGVGVAGDAVGAEDTVAEEVLLARPMVGPIGEEEGDLARPMVGPTGEEDVDLITPMVGTVEEEGALARVGTEGAD